MTTITAVDRADVRFPTSLSMDGSDAMNKDGDYSAAYVVLDDRRPRPVGLRLHVHHRPRQRPLRRGRAAARPAADRPRRRRARRRPRRRLPASCSRLAAALARPGEGRRAPGPGRGDERGLGPRRPPRRQAAVAAARRHDARAARRRRRPALPLRRAHPRRGDRPCCASWRRPGATRIAELERAAATPATRRAPAGSATPTTSCAGCCQEAVDAGLPARQAQGRREPRRRHPAAAASRAR